MFGGTAKKPQGQDLAIPQNSNIRADEIIETSIGSSVSMQGTLKAEGNIRIDGLFEGQIETAGNVIIGRTGKVAANITARNVLVAGMVVGNIIALEQLDLISSGRIKGDIEAATLHIEEGGKISGQTRMIGGEDDADQFLLESPR